MHEHLFDCYRAFKACAHLQHCTAAPAGFDVDFWRWKRRAPRPKNEGFVIRVQALPLERRYANGVMAVHIPVMKLDRVQVLF